MFIYTYPTKLSTRPSRPHPNSSRASFAREAAIDAFGPRAVYALDEPDVYSHRPDHGPRPLGQIAAKVADDTGIKAFRHWMAQAAQAESADAHGVAIEIATEIARLLSLPGINPRDRFGHATHPHVVNLQHYQVGNRAIPRDSTA